MKKVFLIAYILFVLIQLTACNEKTLINDSNQRVMEINESLNKEEEDKNNLTIKQEITTNNYSISIPKEWSYEELDTGMVYFMKEDKEVGGVFIQPFYSDLSEPIKGLLPNHSEITEVKELVDFFTETQQIKIITTPPAVSDIKESKKWIYIFFIVDKTMVYEIFFNTKYIDEDNVLEIAKSFKVI